VLLTRLFSIIQWHHFAYMIISIALLGFGASGTFLTLAGAWLGRRFRASFAASATLAGVTAVGGFVVAEHLPFNPLELLWSGQQVLWLMLAYLLLMVPFFFGATAIGLALLHFRSRVAEAYAADLAGAGLGAAAVVGALFVVRPEQALTLVGLAGLGAGALALARGARARALVWLLLGALAVLAPHLPGPPLVLSPYKALSQALDTAGARLVTERSSPLALVSVVANEEVPFRHAPGLSLRAPATPPPALALYSDGDAASAIPALHLGDDAFAYLDYLITAAPYHVLEPRRVLVLGAGGGSEVFQALRAGARRVDAVELNGDVVELVRDDFRELTAGLYEREQVRVHVAEARSFVAATRERYDLVQIALLDAFAASSAGLYALSESYVYTVEALVEYLGRLEPGGMLALTRWIKVPPRDGPKLFATAVEALERLGVAEPATRLAWIRSWSTGTLMIKNGVWSEWEIERLRAFSRSRGFDLVHYPGMRAAEANRHNRLERPLFHQAASALLGEERERFVARYKFDIRPASDDRPYFFNFFKWSTLPELIELRTRGGAALLETGQLIVVATALQAVGASALLIALPLALTRRLPAASPGVRRVRIFAYFAAIGLAYLFVEIAFIHRFILFLGHPLYAVAAVLAAFLAFSGLGSRLSAGRAGGVARPLAVVVLIGGCYAIALPPLFGELVALAAPVKIALSVILIAPLATAMGMPFPRALAALGQSAPALMPWAWAINGCASVVSAVLAVLLASQAGFTAVLMAALGLYAGAWLCRPETFVASPG